MFREDKKGTFVKKGIFWYRYHFQSGKFITVKGDNKEAYIALIKKQEDLPVVIMNNSEIHTMWWMFQDKFYVEDEGYTAEQIKALVLEKQIRREKRIQRAMLVVENKKITPDKKRDLIPDEVKMFVWRRDEGKCIK